MNIKFAADMKEAMGGQTKFVAQDRISGSKRSNNISKKDLDKEMDEYRKSGNIAKNEKSVFYRKSKNKELKSAEELDQEMDSYM